MSNKPEWQQLDKYYTDKKVAEHCWNTALEKIEDFTGFDMNSVWYYEPCAGSGSFFNLMPPDRRIGVDIKPECEGVIQCDFNKAEIPDKDKTWICVTNPYFGYRLKGAREVFNRLALFCDAIVFIAPHSFCRYNNANRLLKTHRLIYQEPLDENSFHTPAGKKYRIPAELSVWVKTNRAPVIQKPANNHPDFKCFRYDPDNKTSIRHFDDFDLAIRHSYYQSKDDIKYKKQDCRLDWKWIVIKTKDNIIKYRLSNIDWSNVVSNDRNKNVCIHHIYSEYTKLYGDGTYIPAKPARNHPDFDIQQYHNLRKNEEVFDKPFDLAINNSNYGSKVEIQFHKDKCDRTATWNVIRCNKEGIKERLLSIDYAKNSSSTQGRKNVPMYLIVEEYTNKYGDGSYLPVKQHKLHNSDFECVRAIFGTNKCKKLIDSGEYIILRMLRPYNIDIKSEKDMKKGMTYYFIKGKKDVFDKIDWKQYTDKHRGSLTRKNIFDAYEENNG